jgi:hypothetical protein
MKRFVQRGACRENRKPFVAIATPPLSLAPQFIAGSDGDTPRTVQPFQRFRGRAGETVETVPVVGQSANPGMNSGANENRIRFLLDVSRHAALGVRAWRFAAVVVLAGAMALGSGCALYRNDRCWAPPEQYALARDLFIQTGSLDLVQRSLVDLEWETCKINEAVYRLQKEFEVLPEDRGDEPGAGGP